MGGEQVQTTNTNSHTTTFGDNGSINFQSNNQRTTTATGGGPNFNFKINGQDADLGDFANVLGGLFGKDKSPQLNLQNLGMIPFKITECGPSNSCI